MHMFTPKWHTTLKRSTYHAFFDKNAPKRKKINRKPVEFSPLTTIFYQGKRLDFNMADYYVYQENMVDFLLCAQGGAFAPLTGNYGTRLAQVRAEQLGWGSFFCVCQQIELKSLFLVFKVTRGFHGSGTTNRSALARKLN